MLLLNYTPIDHYDLTLCILGTLSSNSLRRFHSHSGQAKIALVSNNKFTV